jgi:hypothetical protein
LEQQHWRGDGEGWASPRALFSDNVSRIETAFKQPINAVTRPSHGPVPSAPQGQFRQILGNCCYVRERRLPLRAESTNGSWLVENRTAIARITTIRGPLRILKMLLVRYVRIGSSEKFWKRCPIAARKFLSRINTLFAISCDTLSVTIIVT